MRTYTHNADSTYIIIVVLSKNEDEDYMLRCLEHGASDYILKPLRPDTMKTLFLV